MCKSIPGVMCYGLVVLNAMAARDLVDSKYDFYHLLLVLLYELISLNERVSSLVMVSFCV